MYRRDFIKVFAGGIASVAIGLKLSQGMPDLRQPSFDLVPENVPKLKVRIDPAMSASWNDWRGVYGSAVID